MFWCWQPVPRADSLRGVAFVEFARRLGMAPTVQRYLTGDLDEG